MLKVNSTEGLTDEEIAAIKASLTEPTLEERLAALESAMLDIALRGTPYD